MFVLFYSLYLIQLYANKKRVRKNGLLIGFSSISAVYSALSNSAVYFALSNNPIVENAFISASPLSSIMYRIFSRLIARRVFCRRVICPLQRLPPSYSDKTLPPEAYFRQNLFPIRKYWRSLAEYCLHD